MLAGVVPRAKKDKKLIDMIHRLADVIEQVPYCMMRAGNELRAWVKEELPTSLLDVSYCKAVLRPRPTQQVPAVSVLVPGRAMAFEPEQAHIQVVGVGGRGEIEFSSSSAESMLWCSVAYDLVKSGMSWAQALKSSELMCKRLDRVRLARDEVDNDQMPEALDVADLGDF